MLTSDVGRASNDCGNLVIEGERWPMGTLNFLFGIDLNLSLKSLVKIPLICELGTLNFAPLVIQTTKSLSSTSIRDAIASWSRKTLLIALCCSM